MLRNFIIYMEYLDEHEIYGMYVKLVFSSCMIN